MFKILALVVLSLGLMGAVNVTPASADDWPPAFEELVRQYCQSQGLVLQNQRCVEVSLASGPRIRPEPAPEKRSADFTITPYSYPTSWPSAPQSPESIAWNAYWATHPNPGPAAFTFTIQPPKTGDGGIR